MEDFAASLGDIGRGVGPYFGAAFLVIVFIWVQFLVRWRDEKRELGLARRRPGEAARPARTVGGFVARRIAGSL